MPVKRSRHKHHWKMRLIIFFAPLFHIILRIYFSTCRVKIFGKEHEERFMKEGKPMLFVSWHQGLIYFMYHFRDRNGIIMVSRSMDGDLIARTLTNLGYQSARGSNSDGAASALLAMIKTIKNTNCSGGVVADAPRGPAFDAKIGIVKIARETGLPILPVMFWAKKNIIFRSWDKTMLPLPFSPINFYYEEPIFVPADACDETMEKIRADLTDQLNEMHQIAVDSFGK